MSGTNTRNTAATPAEPAMQAIGHTESTPGGAVQPFERLPVLLRPDRSLLTYYLLCALLFGPGFFIAVFPFYFRFRSLRYDVDDEGITMRWGILFRREVSLTYARIQDIQLTSNVVERRLGLARIQVQTASGSASAEMTLEGVRDVEALRDFLYSRMRGGLGYAATPDASAVAGGGTATAGDPGLAELTCTLTAVAAEVRALREAIEAGARRGGGHDA